jgi:hypothetical protein
VTKDVCHGLIASLAVLLFAIAMVAIFYLTNPGGRTIDVLGVHGAGGSMSFSFTGIVWWFLGLPALSALLNLQRRGLRSLHR